MDMYGYQVIRESDLMHHGIKGQKWGVRRFQNEDGSLTTKGKSRYKRGKEYAKEEGELSNSEYWKLRNNSREYNKIEKEAYRIADKYDLDQDDGGGGDYTRFTENQLRNAGARYWNLMEDLTVLDEQLQENASKYAKEQLIKKYGDAAFSDIDYSTKVDGAKAVAIMLGIVGGMIWLSNR